MARKKREKTDEAPGFGEPEARPRLTPVDVQQHVFRLAFRGYNERDVDEFLDQVTEDLAALHEENKRLREQVEEGGPGTGGSSVAAAQRQAQAIVRQAREHAARLTASAGGGGGLPSTFLLEERRFLQRVASLVQEHAGWLKDEARRARQAPPAPEPVEEPMAVPEPEPVEVAAERAPSTRRTSVDEPTAAWSPEPQGDEKDPLVSAWESAWAPDEPPTSGPQKSDREGEEGEPSLRELFWGEE